MRRLGLAFAVAACLVAASVGAVSAAPAKGCADASSDFQPIELNFTWVHGDSIPGPGGDAWWDLTVAGFAAEGTTPADFAASIGLTEDEFYENVVTGIRAIDKNGDHWICWKSFPTHSNGQAAYIFNVVDGNAAQH